MKVLTIYIALLAHTEGSSYKGMTLMKVDDPYNKLWKFPYTATVNITTDSTAGCAMKCLTDNTCSAISYEAKSSSCNLGICAIEQPVTRSPSVELFQMQKTLCNSTPGFNIETNGNTSACFWWSDVQKNFTDAMKDCLDKGSILGTFKTWEKFQMLRRIPARIFIGLDDMKVEGTFRWHDDNSVLDTIYSKKIFQPGDPNDPDGTQNCISSFEYYNGLVVDHYCYVLQRYVCEKICYK